MSGLRVALVVLPIVIVVMIAAVLAVVYNQVADPGADVSAARTESSVIASEDENDDKLLILVSPKKPLPDDYETDLVDFRSIRLDMLAVDDLGNMLSDAQKDGVSLLLVGGYVSVQEQNELYEDEVRRLMAREGQSKARAAEDAELTVPMGGHADEQTGLSVRFSSGRSLDFSSSEEYTWLMNNSYKYGFILRYPENKQRYTDRTEDHSLFRYVGKDNAVKLRTLNMCLDEYIVYLNYR